MDFIWFSQFKQSCSIYKNVTEFYFANLVWLEFICSCKNTVYFSQKCLFFFFVFLFFRGSSQTRGWFGAVAASLRHSHSNTRSEPHLHHSNPLKSLTHWMRPGIKPGSSWILVMFITTEPQQELFHRNILNNLHLYILDNLILKCQYLKIYTHHKIYLLVRKQYSPHKNSINILGT